MKSFANNEPSGLPSQHAVQPKAIVVGGGGGLGRAVVTELLEEENYAVHTIARDETAPPGGRHWPCDYSDTSITETAMAITEAPGRLARLVICNGVLHGEAFRPERTIKQVTRQSMAHVLEINTVLPLLWLAAFSDAIKYGDAPRIAVFSARVGSIGDNALGGWVSYRASKAALNMALKCAAIEFSRLNESAKLLAFHPGTVDTAMSEPFQKGVPAGKLFSPAYVAQQLLGILDSLEPDGELSYLDWAGKTVPW